MDPLGTADIIEYLREEAGKAKAVPGVPTGFMSSEQMAKLLNCSVYKVYELLDALGPERIEVYRGKTRRRDGVLTGCPYYRIKEETHG